MKKYEVIILLLVNIIAYCAGFAEKCRPKIAIIGGGIGGASAAHFISELSDKSVDIDIFEANTIGGRLATVKINDDEFEAGGAIIHNRNELMKRFRKLLDLEERPTSPDDIYGIWDGKDLLFQESTSAVMTLAKLVYRYGFNPVFLHMYVSSVLDDFERIYKLHDDGHAFLNVTGLLAAMNGGFPDMLKTSIKDHLTNLGYSSQLIDELVQASLVVNYGQETDVQSFVGCVSITGAGSELWSVKGGNKRVVEGLIGRLGNVRTRAYVVDRIGYNQGYDWSSQKSGHPYSLRYRAKGGADEQEDEYDIVILATPLTSDQALPIKFEGFSNEGDFEFSGKYQTIYATFVEGQLNASYFGLDEPIQGILSSNPGRTVISSVGKLSSVEGKESNVWKIFTRNPVELEFIEQMFQINERSRPITREWKATPKYSTTDKPLNFKLHNALYHVNPIEWAASAMEMSAIGGRNVAILVYNDYLQHCKTSKGFEAKKRKLHSSVEL